MKLNYTPGPWLQWADTNLVIRLHSGEPRSEDLRICEVSTNTRNDEGAANARLIAAAPDMLAVLLKLRRGDLHQRVRPLYDEAQAAIAKATGSIT